MAGDYNWLPLTVLLGDWVAMASTIERDHRGGGLDGSVNYIGNPDLWFRDSRVSASGWIHRTSRNSRAVRWPPFVLWGEKQTKSILWKRKNEVNVHRKGEVKTHVASSRRKRDWVKGLLNYEWTFCLGFSEQNLGP